MRIYARISALCIAFVMSVAVLVPAADASTASPQTSATIVAGKIGDGVWTPSHDEALAIIPLCKGPAATLDWLNKNFTDHGRDIGLFLKTQAALLKLVAQGNSWALFQFVLTPVLQVPIYAINDTTFHVPATLKDILSFCASSRQS